jgi:hypothetical protein
MIVKKHDHYNVMYVDIWSAPVGTPPIPLGEEFPVPDPDDKKAPKPVWKYEGHGKYAGFSEGFLDGSKDADWLEMRAGTVRNTNPCMYIARGELENNEYDAQIVYFELRDGVLYRNKEGDPIVIQISKKVL